MRRLTITSAVVCISFLSGIVVLTLTARDAGPAAADSCYGIPSCAFEAQRNSYDYNNSGNLELYSGTGTFRAPINIPHGSMIMKVRLVCMDNGNADIKCTLTRQRLDDSFYGLIAVSSNGKDSALRSFSGTAISPRYVNNFKFNYYVSVSLPGTSAEYKLAQVKIYYNAP